MRSKLILVAALLLAGCDRPAADRESTSQGNAEAELRAANAAYDKALIDGDSAALDRFYASDFQIIDDDGKVHDKQNQIQFMTEKVDLLNARGDDVQVTMLGPESALVTGRFSGRYRMDGKEADFRERYTSVWIREDGRWQVRHEHTSMLSEGTAGVSN